MRSLQKSLLTHQNQPILVCGYDALAQLLLSDTLTVTELSRTQCLLVFMENLIEIAGKALTDFAAKPLVGAALMQLLASDIKKNQLVGCLSRQTPQQAYQRMTAFLIRNGFAEMINPSLQPDEILSLSKASYLIKSTNPELHIFWMHGGVIRSL